MKKRIVSILVMTLLIATTILPAASSFIATKISNPGEVLDQHSDWSDDCRFFSGSEWQEFIPSMVTHTRVEVKIAQWFGGSPDLKLTIEKPLGTVLTSKEMPASKIPSGICGWVSFDIPDINLIPGNNYYLKLNAPLGSEYGWGFSANGLYPPGTSSIWPADWCFRTYCLDNTPPTKPNGPYGPTSGKKGQKLTYTYSSTDADGDKIRYGLDFVGDDFIVDDWTDDYYNSAYIVTTYLTFNIEGTHTFRVIAEDEQGAQSEWSDPLRISISKGKEKTNDTPFLKFLENYPILYQLLQRILKL